MPQPPRFFSPSPDLRLTPEVMGERFWPQVAALAKSRNYLCEYTGWRILPGAGSSEAKAGFFRMEVIDPMTSKDNLFHAGNIRLIEPVSWYSRHVDIAIKEGMGRMIFAPWIEQDNLNGIARILMMAIQCLDQPDQRKQMNAYANRLDLLGSPEIMLAATGLEGQVENWNAAEWLAGVRSLSKGERLAYMKSFGQHLRFWPSFSAFDAVVNHWLGYCVNKNDRANLLHLAIKAAEGIESRLPGNPPSQKTSHPHTTH